MDRLCSFFHRKIGAVAAEELKTINRPKESGTTGNGTAATQKFGERTRSAAERGKME
jgi:hypothetical protein